MAKRFSPLEALLTLASRNVDKQVFFPMKVQISHFASSVPLSETPFFNSGAMTSGLATSAQDSDEKTPASSEPNMNMKSPLANMV